MQTHSNAKEKIAELVERFEEQKESYRKSDYNETQTRRDFIDPFFKALGWDVANEKGNAESYREVIHEDRVKVGRATKAPDYSFRLEGGKRLFFVEAKKPSVQIKSETTPAYQVRRYGWSAKLPISVITDFEEFAIYDCTKRPNLNDKASTARLKYLTYTDYIGEFNFIWDTFSKERVLKGSFDKFVQNDSYKKGTSTIDRDFLESLDRWRIYLAQSICKSNRHLNEEEINYVVQQTIDRIIFLRIAEDRSIEPYGSLKDCLKHGSLYQNLFSLFKAADDKYNSGLFDFDKDRISRNLEVENSVVKTIINELYYPASPYEFDYLPVEILGTAYEQFLGRQIKINDRNKITIEDKPEVRKAGGVYYTPQYIVDYIVSNTVGKIIEGKTPKEISRVKILDPACGSGSFLLGAYQHLLDYHRTYYNTQKTETKGSIKSNPLRPDGNLTTAEKKRILINNIYGVDIDANAVEVTKLSLLLKCMEGETEASIAMQMSLFHERVLPTLDNNIKDGNSLIDTDFYATEFDFGEDKKIKPFNWKRAFTEVFKQGGFDVVVGNPPYVQPDILDYNSRAYIKERYKANTDLYSVFIEKSFSLLTNSSLFGFIVPSLFIKGVRYKTLREVINENAKQVVIKEFGDGVFEKVKMPTCVMILTKGKPGKVKNHFTVEGSKYFTHTQTITLGAIAEIKRGLEIGRDKLHETGSIPCITGGNMDTYRVKRNSFITRDTYNQFAKDRNIFTPPRVIVRETGNRFFAATDTTGIVTTRSIYNITITNKNYTPAFITGILNSSLLSFYFKQFIAPDTKVFPKIRIAQLKEVPLPVNHKHQTDIEKHVTHITELYNKLDDTSLHTQTNLILQRIEHHMKAIDKYVFNLYNLNEEERNIVQTFSR